MGSTSERSNPYETAARYAKAVRLSRVMIAVVRQSGVLTADDVATAAPSFRRRAAKLAGVRPPSEATWALVVELVRNATEPLR